MDETERQEVAFALFCQEEGLDPEHPDSADAFEESIEEQEYNRTEDDRPFDTREEHRGER